MQTRHRRVLEALAAHGGDMYGLDIVATGAAARGALYVLLARLEELGWVEGREELTPAHRRRYRITPSGHAALLPTATALR